MDHDRSGNAAEVGTRTARQLTASRLVPLQREEPLDGSGRRVYRDHPLVLPGLARTALEEEQVRRVPDAEVVIEQVVPAQLDGRRPKAARGPQDDRAYGGIPGWLGSVV